MFSTCRSQVRTNPPKSYSIIDRVALRKLFDVTDDNRIRNEHRDMVETKLKNEPSQRNPMGSEYYIQKVEKRLGGRAIGRSVVSSKFPVIMAPLS